MKFLLGNTAREVRRTQLVVFVGSAFMIAVELSMPHSLTRSLALATLSFNVLLYGSSIWNDRKP